MCIKEGYFPSNSNATLENSTDSFPFENSSQSLFGPEVEEDCQNLYSQLSILTEQKKEEILKEFSEHFDNKSDPELKISWLTNRLTPISEGNDSSNTNPENQNCGGTDQSTDSENELPRYPESFYIVTMFVFYFMSLGHGTVFTWLIMNRQLERARYQLSQLRNEGANQRTRSEAPNDDVEMGGLGNPQGPVPVQSERV